MTNNPAVHAINFALKTDEGLDYLRAWHQGDFDRCRREWPEAPELCYTGAELPVKPIDRAKAEVTESIRDSTHIVNELKAITQMLEQRLTQRETIGRVADRLKALVIETSPDPQQARQSIAKLAARAAARSAAKASVGSAAAK